MREGPVTLEEREGAKVRTKQPRHSAQASLSNLFRIKGAADVGGEAVKRVKVTKSLVQQAIALENKPQQRNRDGSEDEETRRHKGKTERGTGDCAVDDEEPTGDPQVTGYLPQQRALEERDCDRYQHRGDQAGHEDGSHCCDYESAVILTPRRDQRAKDRVSNSHLDSEECRVEQGLVQRWAACDR